MPIISRFYGISIMMFFAEHRPPHFHAKYEGEIAVFNIRTHRIIAGHLPPYAKKLVLKWLKLHKKELLENWDRIEKENKTGLKAIEPLL